jgi:hypothetical protein
MLFANAQAALIAHFARFILYYLRQFQAACFFVPQTRAEAWVLNPEMFSP